MPKYGGQNRIDFGVHFNTDKSSLEDVKKSLQALQNIKLTDFKGSREELVAIKTEALKVQAALTSAFNVKIGSLNIEKFKKELDGLNIDKLYTDFSRLGSAGQVAFSKMATSMMTTNLQLKETHSLINSMGTTMMNTVKWGIASSVMNNFTQSVSQAFQYVKSLDSALTDIRIVTGDSTEQMAQFADQANRAAQELGRSTMDYSKAALTFYQQGLSDEDVAARTEATLKAQNITGAGQEMADYLTAVWNGYKVANEEAELYVDKLAAVADSSASNMSQLAVAMSKVASTANMLGVPVDSLNAQIATIEATTRQAPETVGNALKTIYARINDIKTGSDDAEVSLGNYTEQMAKLGVNVLDASGNLRDTGDVIEQIGGKWETLSREQQIYLARTMAGQRQYNNLLALFENWGKYTDLVNVSMEAQGTTMQKNSRYMDSLAAHMEQLGAAGERVKSAMIDSDSFKGLIDIGTGLTNLFANLIESIGGGGTAFLALGSIVTQVFSGVISREIANVINNFKIADENAQALARDIELTKEFGKSQAYTDGVIDSMVKAKEAGQQYYNTMTEGQINAYNGIVQQIGAAQQQIASIEKETQAANSLNDAFIKAFGEEESKYQLIAITDDLEKIKEQTDIVFDSFNSNSEEAATQLFTLQDKFKSFSSNLGSFNFPGFEQLKNKIDNINPSAEDAKNKINSLRLEVIQFFNEANKELGLINKVDDLNNKTQQYEAQLKQAKNTQEDFLNTVKTQAQVKNFTNMVSAIGRLASGFMALSNLTKVWHNDSLSTGQKVLQTITNISFVIPMIVTALKTIQTTLGFQQTLGQIILANLQLRLLTEKKITIEKAKQALLEKNGVSNWTSLKGTDREEYLALNKSLDGIKEKIAGIKTSLGKDGAGLSGWIETAKSGFGKVLTGLKAIVPQLTIVGGLIATAFIAKKVSDYGMRVQYATQRLEEFKTKQKEVNDSIKDTNTKTGSLEKSQAEYQALAKKAGANTGDSTINNLTQAQKQRYNELKNLIAEYNSDAVVGYDEQGNAILKNNDALKDTIELLKEKNREQLKSFYDSKEYKQAVKDRQTVYEGAVHDAGQESGNKLQSSRKHEAEIDLKSYKAEVEKLGSTYLKQNQELQKLLDEGIEKIDEAELKVFHKSLISKIEASNPQLAKALQQRYDQAQQQLQVYQKGQKNLDSKSKAAKDKAEQLGKFTLDQAINPLIANSEDEEYNNLAQQYGESVINGIVNSYISGLSRADVSEEDLPEKVRTELLKPLNDINFTEKDFDGIKNSVQSAMEDIDISNLTGQDYATKMQEAMQAILDSSPKLQEMQKEAPEAFSSIMKNLFNVEDFTIDKNGLVTKIVDEYTKAAGEAQTKLEIALEDEKISLTSDQEDNINTWISEQNVSTLANFDEILQKVKQDGEYTADAFQRAKNEVNDMAVSEALSGAAGLLQKKARGEDLDQKEQGQLSGYLTQLKTLIPQYKEVVEILQNEYLQGTQYYQRAIEEVVNGTLSMMEAAKNARIEDEENQFKNGKIGASEVNRGPTDSQSAEALKLVENTENLQAAQSKGLLTSEDYSKGLEKLASQYDTCKNELSQYAQALANGNEQAIKNTASTLLLSTHAAELAEQSGLNADQIERVATMLANENPILKENSELAADAAERYIRLNNAFDNLYTNGDKYKQMMAEIGSSNLDAIYSNQELFNTFDQFKTQVADIFDTEKEFLGDDWVVRHMQEIQAAAENGGKGLDELREAAAEEILAHLGLDDYPFYEKKDQFLTDLQSLKEGDDLNVEVTPGLNLQDWTQQLVTAMQQAGYAQGQIESALKGMNIDVDLVPYENKLIKATQDANKAGQAIAEGMSTDAEGVSKEITDNYENVTPNMDFDVREVTADYIYPIATEGIMAPGEPKTGTFKIKYPRFVPKATEEKTKGSNTAVAQALKVKSAKKSFGGKISNYNMPAARNARKARSGSGGGGKKGGGGGSKSFTPAKPKTTKIESKQKTQQNDPYYKINKSIDKQSSLLKKLQGQEKNLSGKDRLKNLEAQAEALKEQNELLEERQRISDNVAAENSTANLRKRLKDSFGSNIAFDSDGKFIDKNTIQRAAVDAYNNAEKIANATYKKQQDAYNKWLTTVYDLNQEKYKSEKETRDEKLKNAEEERKEAIKLAEDEYKKKTDLIKAYEKALQDDLKNYEQYMENVRSLMQKTFESRKLRVQFTLDSGELDREYQDFENKVIRRIKDSDIVGNAAAQFRELSSYIQSQELQSVSDEIKAISDDIARVNAGAWTQLMGVSQTNYEMLKPEDQQLIRKEAVEALEEQLKNLVKQEQDALSAIQDLTDEIAESYLDSIDAAKDALDEHIDQYERINDLIEHNVKLTELLYGDKGYDILNKYYDLQKQNNMNTLQTLKQQEEYWRSRMQNEVVGSEAWKKFKENLDDAVNAVNSKLEDMLDNLTTQFENKLAAAVERINNKLTGGLGTTYLDEQWDYLNNYDDYFLDTYNATTGIEDVTRAYQQALDDAAANPQQQQRLNKLMNDQLKILREKDKLTQYDLERAKSMLEVEKARMALEDARNNKTKMRLRRDSQGNYTYQYVADEEKLGELQQALADAQNDLYNQDKEHYKENLNTLYDTYKEYIEKMKDLTTEYNTTQDEEERKRIQERIDLAKQYYSNMMTGLLEDNEYNQTYITQSFANGLNLDLSGLSSEEVWGVIQENVPWAASNIQNLANSISNLGGLLPATNSLLQEFSSAVTQYQADANDILEAGGTSIQTISQVVDEAGVALDPNIIEANSQTIMGYLDQITEQAQTDVNTMQSLTKELDQYWQTLNNNIQTYINNTREGYNTLQGLLDSSTKAEVLDYLVPQINTTSTEGLDQAREQLLTQNISGEDINSLYNTYKEFEDQLIQKIKDSPIIGYQQASDNQQLLAEQTRFYEDLVQDMIQRVSNMSIDPQIDKMTVGTSNLLSNLIKNQSLLDQNVHIDANFPNVNNHTQIEEAFNNLVNMAAMRASGYRD